jgi:hypothetical protein
VLGKSAVLVGALLAAAIGPAAAADSTWKSHQDRNCGIALKYPPAYTLKASGAPDFCVLSMDIGVPAGAKLRTLYTLETRDMESVERTELAKTGKPPSARDFALHVATIQCGADGPDGSRYCENGQVRSTFKTAQGFHGFEIHLTEVYETVSPKKTEKRKRGPVFALDLSDDETVRVLMARAAPKHDAELRAILDTLRVWTQARRPTPRVVELSPFRGSPQAFVLRVAAPPTLGVLQPGTTRRPPSPVVSWLLSDPQGRRLGRDFATGAWHAEAPAVTQSSATESGFMLRELLPGRYELQLTAEAASVPYQVSIQAPDQAGKPATARLAGRTPEPGAVDRYEIVYAPASTPALTLAEVAEPWRFRVVLSSRGDATSDPVLTDPQGRPVGRHEAFADLSNGLRGSVLDVRQPIDGAYTLQVTGAAPGSYSLDLRAWDRSGAATSRPDLREVPTGPGAVHVYRLDYGATAAMPLKLGGRFEEGRLLVVANATSAETKVAAGAATFPLVLFYGARIDPVSFNALLDGDNITGRFTPEPGGYQIVRIPLRPGLNTLMLSVEGAAGNRPAAADTLRLVFRVE